MADIEILEEHEHSLRLLVKKTDRAFVNAIRRAMISDVPKFAIDRIRIEQGIWKDEAGEHHESIGSLSDEQLAHRFGMIPIPTFHADFKFMSDCPDCSTLVEEQRGCPSCQIIYAVTESGREGGQDVTAGHLAVIGEPRLEIPDKFKPIVLTRLEKGQILQAYLYAIMGRGRDHSKFSPVAGVTFNPRKIGMLKNKGKAKVLFDLDLGISEKSFKSGKLEDIEQVELLKSALNHVGEGTELADEFDDAIVLEDVEGEFIFKFQTDGSMSARTCFAKACEELSSRFTGISEEFDIAL